MLQSLEQSDMCHRGEQSHDQPPRGFGTQIYFQSVWIRILISSDQKISFNSKTMVSIRLTGTRVCIFGTTQKGREVRPVQRGRPLRPVQLPARQKRTQCLTERKTLSSQHKASHLGDLPFFFNQATKRQLHARTSTMASPQPFGRCFARSRTHSPSAYQQKRSRSRLTDKRRL